MKCEEVKNKLTLFLYGELSFAEEERMEMHMDECDSCRGVLERERAMFLALDGAEATPPPELLEQCRAELRSRLTQVVPERKHFWDKLLQGFSIQFHFAPGIMQPLGLVAMLAIGFFMARLPPPSLLGLRQSVVLWQAAS